MNCFNSTLSIWCNPTRMCVISNDGVQSFWDNVKTSENPVQTICQGKGSMGNVKLTIIRVVKCAKRNWIDTLEPKGTKSGFNCWHEVKANGQTVSGS